MTYVKNNNIYVSKDVIAHYVGTYTNECPGVVGMAMVSLKDGIYKVLKKESAGKGVEVIIEDNKIILNLHIIVLFGIDMLNLTQEIIKTVKYNLKDKLNLFVEEINIYVEGVKITD